MQTQNASDKRLKRFFVADLPIARIEWKWEGCALGRYEWGRRRRVGVLLSLTGVMIIFLCLPMELFLLGLGVILAASGIWMLCE